MSLVIREYHPRDEETVLQLMEKYASWDATPTRADVQGLHAACPELFFVAEVEGMVVGFVYGRETKTIPAETLAKWGASNVVSIETLAVAREYRRRRIGTSLISWFFQTAKANGADLVTLSVPAEEGEARNLYAKLGFEERALFPKEETLR